MNTCGLSLRPYWSLSSIIPSSLFCSLRGYLSYLTNRDFKWKNMERKGFKQKEESADNTDTTPMKPEPATI